MTAVAAASARPDGPARMWRAHIAALGIVAAMILLMFARDAAAMASIWWNSSTFNHILLIPPIIGWLVWQRWGELRLITPQAWLPGLAIVALGGFGWLLGQAAGVALARHFGFVLMLQGAVVACLGPMVARGLAFPLCYALFLVPFGEELVPPLQTLTARMSMALLDLAGVPAHIEGVFISIPNGYFQVAEACSGVKFLIAMAAYGALVANVCFKSWPRRIAFMTVAIVVPILANGVRAWGTIYIAHRISAEFAVGFDHVVYGGIFFALVMAAVMAAGWPFFDRKLDDKWLEWAPPSSRGKPGSMDPGLRRDADAGEGRALVLTALTLLCLAALPLLWSAMIARGAGALTERIDLPAVPGWSRVAVDGGRAWRPHFAGADHMLLGGYRDGKGRAVDLAIAIYARQEEGRELVGFGQGAIGPASDWAWIEDAAPPPRGRAFRIAAPGRAVREVATFYRVGGIVTGSEARVKLETLKVRLLGGNQRAVAVLVSAEGDDARAAIDAFLRALGPMDRVADRAAGL